MQSTIEKPHKSYKNLIGGVLFAQQGLSTLSNASLIKKQNK
jgi:hypothetical protein